MQNLYAENYKTLLKEIKEVLIKWKDIAFSWIERFNVKMAMFFILIYRLSAITFKILDGFFCRT